MYFRYHDTTLKKIVNKKIEFNLECKQTLTNFPNISKG